MMNRRELVAVAGAAAVMAGGRVARAAGRDGIEWRCTTQTAAWVALPDAGWTAAGSDPFGRDVEVRLDRPLQTMVGFGGAFSEKGWEALRTLPEAQRAAVLDALFAPAEGPGEGPGAGLCFTLCRTPMGANDIARGWYSYDEVDGDFALDHFSIANDHETLIPFIREARARQPDLRLWASPWSPPPG
ncbi:hypothetical protein UCD39_07620 [Nitrospirillum sp. BR 11752]|uniref:hypothetical protein n=1 Tax=Nitrospirillum sp. BR 11752 TaxID=3104293 RepID=UPI002E987D15|nr:hypothetical protein [Nitrospirillum sp. BR 11752]